MPAKGSNDEQSAGRKDSCDWCRSLLDDELPPADDAYLLEPI